MNSLPPEILGAIFQYAEYTERPVSTIGSRVRFTWPILQSVCRYWRHTALLTPALWSYIYLREKHLSHESPSYLENISTIHFQRSGVLPLIVDMSGLDESRPVELMPHATLQAIQNIILQSPRICDLRLQSSLTPYILYPFTQETGGNSLETLALLCPGADPTYRWDLFSGLKAPRLRTLCVDGYTGWTLMPFRTLRILVLSGQYLVPEQIRALHTVLLSNPCLTDLVISGECSDLDDHSYLDSLAPVAMPSLKTIYVHNNSAEDSLIAFIEHKLDLRPGYAKFYDPLWCTTISRIFPIPEQYYFPLSRLFVGPIDSKDEIGWVIGTDGVNSLCLNTSIAAFLLRYSQAGHSPIHELWLFAWAKSQHDDGADWSTALHEMKRVKKLVLRRGISNWLTHIHERALFPSLSELQLHFQLSERIPLILDFVKRRRDAGYPIDTLRFVLHAKGKDAQETFLACRDNVAQFRSVVPQILFIDRDEVTPEMELPEICTTNSALHDDWISWSTHMKD